MVKCDVCAEPITTKNWLMTWDKDMGLTLNVCKWCNPIKFNLSSGTFMAKKFRNANKSFIYSNKSVKKTILLTKPGLITEYLKKCSFFLMRS